MGDLWGYLLMLGLAAPLVGFLAAICYLVWRFDRSHQRRAREAPEAYPSLYPSVLRLVLWGSVATAFVLPWGVGVAIKLILDHRGLPTYPWSSFLSPTAILVLIPVTLFLWGFPFPALGLIARYSYLARAKTRSVFKERLLELGVAYLFGVAAGLFVFWGVFREFDFLYVFVPLGAYLAVPMLAGWLAAKGAMTLRRRMTAGGAGATAT